MAPTIGPNFNAHSARRVTRKTSQAPISEPEVPEQPEGEPEVVEQPENAVEVPSDLTTIKALEAWVGDDQAKAQAVLDAETSKPESEQRKTLISKMTDLVSADGSDLI